MGWRPPLPKVAAFELPRPSNTRSESAGVIVRTASDSGGKLLMRRTVPFVVGIWRRGPAVGSSTAFGTIFAGISCVRHMSTENQSCSALLMCTDGAGPSDTTTARPLSSCPVTTRRIGLTIVDALPANWGLSVPVKV
jgi:hypothetical protein